MLEQLAGRRLLDHTARVHDDDLVGAVGHDPEVVGHEHHRHRTFALLVGQQVEYLRLHGHVEARGRLVGEQQLRAAGERDGDHHALAHPARQLVRVDAQAPDVGSGMPTESSSATAVS